MQKCTTDVQKVDVSKKKLANFYLYRLYQIVYAINVDSPLLSILNYFCTPNHTTLVNSEVNLSVPDWKTKEIWQCQGGKSFLISS